MKIKTKICSGIFISRLAAFQSFPWAHGLTDLALSWLSSNNYWISIEAVQWTISFPLMSQTVFPGISSNWIAGSGAKPTTFLYRYLISLMPQLMILNACLIHSINLTEFNYLELRYYYECKVLEILTFIVQHYTYCRRPIQMGTLKAQKLCENMNEYKHLKLYRKLSNFKSFKSFINIFDLNVP